MSFTQATKAAALTTTTWLNLLLFVLSCVPAVQDPLPHELSGYTADEIFSLTDERPLAENDPDVFRLLERAIRSSTPTINRFKKITGPVTLNQIANSPHDFRCHVVEVAGRAKSIHEFRIGNEKQRPVFLVHVVDQQEKDCIVCLPTIPELWRQQTTIDESVKAAGFFLANFDLKPDPNVANQMVVPELIDNTPLIVAKKMQWYPTDPESKIQVKPSQRVLAKHGVDISIMEHVSPEHRLMAEDSELFYQMLAACRNVQRNQIPASKPFTHCLKQPRNCIGEALYFTGQLRRATQVQIEDPIAIETFGQDYYYQLDVFVPLDHQQIVIRNPANKSGNQSESNPIVHENRYPIIVCVPSLPVSVADIWKQKVAINGFFLKLWDYESGVSSQDPNAPKQISPLVIGLPPQVIQTGENPLNIWIAMAAIVGFCGLGFFLWLISADRRKSISGVSRSSDDLPDEIEIPSID